MGLTSTLPHLIISAYSVHVEAQYKLEELAAMVNPDARYRD
jgi:hypothetical protein